MLGVWEQHKLGSLGHATGGIPIESEFSKDGVYKVISIGSYSTDNTYHDQGIRAIKSEKTKSRLLNKNDLTMILNDKTTIEKNIIGRTLLIEESGVYVYNQRTERIELDITQFDPSFIYEELNAPHIRQKIIAQSQGNTQVYVNWSSISQLVYSIPSLSEQQKIGSFFRKLDDLLALHQRQTQKLTELKQGLLHEMFPREGESVPRLRFPGFTTHWEQHKLSDVGIILTGSTPSTKHNEYYAKDGIPWVTPTDITTNITVDTPRKLSFEGAKVARVVPKDTILVTCIASIGKNTILGTTGSFNQQINCVVPYTDQYDPYFLYTNSFFWSQTMKTEAASGIMQIVNKTEFSHLLTVTPSLSEQRKIGSFFRTLDDLLALHEQYTVKLTQLKKGLLQKMFPQD